MTRVNNLDRFVKASVHAYVLFVCLIGAHAFLDGIHHLADAEETIADFPAPQLGYASALDENGEEYTIPAEILYPRFFNKRGAVGAARDGNETNPERRSSS